MRITLPALLCLLAVPLAAQERMVLPSGLEVTLQEVLWDAELEIGRFRFIAPAIATAGLDDNAILSDMTALCRDVALPIVRAEHDGWQEVVISFASAPSEFGVTNPEIVQFFEGFAIDGDDCIWSQF